MNTHEALQRMQEFYQDSKPWERGVMGWWLAAARRYKLALLLPPLTLMVLSTGYALWGPKKWQAAQVFHLRDETIGRPNRPGSFDSLDDMKTAQESVLEVARSPNVLRKTLLQLGPTSANPPANWPSDRVIEETQSAVQISASNGAELGKSELIRLSVVASTPERARRFATLLCEQAEIELRKIRFDRASSMLDELQTAVANASQSLEETAKKIELFELELGPDLAELRNIIEPKTGDILLYRNLGQIQSELRAAQSDLQFAIKQRELLREAESQPGKTLSTPNELFDLQPNIRRLKDGLIDAQLKLATIQGEYSQPHPKVRSAIGAVGEIETALASEVRIAIASLDDQIRLNRANVERLQDLETATTARLQRLTDLRVTYDQLNEQYKQRDAVVRQLQNDSERAASIKAAAATVSLLTRVDNVQVGSQPLGPSNKVVVAGSTALGLVCGIGLLMVLAGPPPARPGQPNWPHAVGTQPAIREPSVAPQNAAETARRPDLPKPPQRQSILEQLTAKGSFAVTVRSANQQLESNASE